MGGLGIHPDVYLAAAEDNARAAELLHEQEHFARAHYLAGVAVECILRAYRVRANPEFDARHDIRALAKQAGCYEWVRPGGAESVAEAVRVVSLRWSNDHRYRSEDALWRWLKEHAGEQGSGRERRLRHSSKTLLDAMLTIVQEGVLRWGRRSY